MGLSRSRSILRCRGCRGRRRGGGLALRWSQGEIHVSCLSIGGRGRPKGAHTLATDARHLERDGPCCLLAGDVQVETVIGPAAVRRERQRGDPTAAVRASPIGRDVAVDGEGCVDDGRWCRSGCRGWTGRRLCRRVGVGVGVGEAATSTDAATALDADGGLEGRGMKFPARTPADPRITAAMTANQMARAQGK